MGMRQREWARRWTSILKWLLGYRCAYCGIEEGCEFDVKIPVKPHSQIEWSVLISFYRREYEKGNLQLLCRSCNARKNDRLILTGEVIREPDPF